MDEILSINIKYSLKDLKEFSFSKTRSGIHKISFIFSFIFTILLAIGIFAIVFTFSSITGMLVTVILMMIPVLFIWGVTLLPAFTTYLNLRNSFNKSKLLGILQCYKVYEDKLEICSENGSFCLLWNDVYKVQELKPCFVFQSSPGKMFLIPRRCFCSQEQLDLFVDIMNSSIDKKKIKLKRYRLRNSNPDYGEIKLNENISQTAELKYDQGDPVIEAQFSLSKNEYLAMNFRLYYTKPVGLIFTAIGILLIVTSIRNHLFSVTNSIVTLILGATFTLVIPLMLYSNSVKRYEKDAALKKPYIYKFYEEYFMVEHPSGTNRIRFCDLVKVAEMKTAIMFYVTTQIAHVVPKRVFKGREDELESLRGLLKRIAAK